MTTANDGTQVLVVDDDSFSRRFAELLLTRAGYVPIAAESAEEARAAILQNPAGSFACILTDHLLPGQSGLDLLAWAKSNDPTLAGVLMTADHRKALVEEALQSGAVDFLNKPFRVDQLRDAVAKAVAATLGRRELAQMERDVEQVAEVQRRMVMGNDQSPSSLHKVCFHPRHQAGGDSFSLFEISPARSVALMTDVSGHDLKAAFVSAYFQGMVRAMLEAGIPLPRVFDRCNRFLLEEWTDPAGASASIAACSVLLDWDSQTIEVLSRGAPDPILAYSDGRVLKLGAHESSPLGWFPEPAGDSVSIPMSPGEILLWTDGLEDAARELGVSALSAANALFEALETKISPPWLAEAKDDIMAARVPICRTGEDAPCPRRPCSTPLLNETYEPSQIAEIDALQNYWEKSLRFGAPVRETGMLHDLLLCTREAVLNALKHGCRTPGDRVSLQVSWLGRDEGLRVRVNDPGQGHSFDSQEHAETAASSLVEEHRGLILMRRMPSRFSADRNGASIVMDFLAEE